MPFNIVVDRSNLRLTIKMFIYMFGEYNELFSGLQKFGEILLCRKTHWEDWCKSFIKKRRTSNKVDDWNDTYQSSSSDSDCLMNAEVYFFYCKKLGGILFCHNKYYENWWKCSVKEEMSLNIMQLLLTEIILSYKSSSSASCILLNVDLLTIDRRQNEL